MSTLLNGDLEPRLTDIPGTKAQRTCIFPGSLLNACGHPVLHLWATNILKEGSRQSKLSSKSMHFPALPAYKAIEEDLGKGMVLVSLLLLWLNTLTKGGRTNHRLHFLEDAVHRSGKSAPAEAESWGVTPRRRRVKGWGRPMKSRPCPQGSSSSIRLHLPKIPQTSQLATTAEDHMLKPRSLCGWDFTVKQKRHKISNI